MGRAGVGARLLAPPRQISESGFGAYEVSLAVWNDGLAVAWYDTRDGNAEVYVRSLDEDGREAGAELRLTNTAAESYEADIAPLKDAFAIAWYEKSHDEVRCARNLACGRATARRSGRAGRRRRR